ncbi:MAG: hypothetical protein LUF85_11515 [Bacteroides sp.]|nr:hypothetical protein [Bacteroides sp.]
MKFKSMKSYNCLLISLLISCSVYAQHEQVRPLVDFLKEQPLTAKEYVIDQFKEKDIVILCERNHGEITQYDLFLDIIKDPYFIENVGTVYTEIGMDIITPQLDTFLMKEGLDSTQVHKEVTNLLRETKADCALWAPHSYPWLITKIYALNQTLDRPQKIHMYPCDMSINWKETHTYEEFHEFQEKVDLFRDSIMADNFIKQFEQIPASNGNKKALVIMNYRHAFLQHIQNKPNTIQQNFGKYIHDNYKDKVASIWINGPSYPNSFEEYTVVKDRLWDAAFELAEKTDVGFSIKGTPFGEVPCDLNPNLWPISGYRYQDLFTGIIYYLPTELHVIKYGWEGAFTEEFKNEFIRRGRIIFGNEADTLLSEEAVQEYMEEINTFEYHTYGDLERLRDKIDQWK